jgi:hypothetical protein
VYERDDFPNSETVASTSTKRNWGPQQEGFALSLTLDRDTYRIDEEVPVHVACSRLTGDWAVMNRRLYPICDPKILVLDAAGEPVAARKTNAKEVLWVGGGRRLLTTIKAGVVVPFEESLVNPSGDFRPQRPGTYEVTAIWAPRDDDALFPVEAEVRSPLVTLHITD